MGLVKRKRNGAPAPLYNWTTEDELHYLQRIGSFAPNIELRTTVRKMQLLRNYIEAAPLRHDWCGMDQARIVNTARRHLAALELQVG